MDKIGFILILTSLTFLAYSKNINTLQARDFDLHNAIQMAHDHEHLEQVLEQATETEVREFFSSVARDCRDIEDLSTKILNHGWTTELELTDEEHELIFHVLIMNSYLPNVGDDGEDLFLDECKVEYMQKDFSQFSSFEEARIDAMVQILECGFNGWRTLERVLDITHFQDSQLKDFDLITTILEKLSRGIREMFTIGRFFASIVETDSSHYPDPSSFNDALKQDAVDRMDDVSVADDRAVAESKRTDVKVDAKKVEAVSRALENIKEIKNRMLLHKLLRALNQKRK